MTERGSKNQISPRLNTVPAIPDSPPRVFVSFRRPSPLVELLLRFLRDDPVVVLDPIFNRSFHDVAWQATLDTWGLEIQRALSRAAVMLLLIDDDWVRWADEFGRRMIDDPADVVHQEIGFALSRNIPIVPVLLGDSRMPPAKALPPPLAELTQFQCIHLRGEHFDSDYHSLVDLLLARMQKTPPASVPSRESPPLLRVKSLELRDFRCFSDLHVELCQPSKLPGHWSCVAGLNGAGKSSLLQALALLLMGPEYSRELGGSRLASMRRRRPDGSTADAYLKARVEHLGQEVTLEMSIDSRGGLAWGGDNLWSSITESLILGFGATRNLSDTPDRYGELSPPARACISLFDSLARLEDGERLLRNSGTAAEGAGNSAAAAKLLTQILKRLLPGEIRAVWTSQHGFQFRSPSRSDDPSVTAYDLPDGFRSTIAWIAETCTKWVSLFREPSLAIDPEELTGIVLIDEIDLHLHATLQRSLVSRLRKILPSVQFIVTSHSPLVLSSFDQHELILLDRDEPGGIRHLDRQILAFTADQVYEWLMGTPASSEAADDYLSEADRLRREGEQLSDVLGVSPDLNSHEAQQRAAQIKARLERLSQK